MRTTYPMTPWKQIAHVSRNPLFFFKEYIDKINKEEFRYIINRPKRQIIDTAEKETYWFFSVEEPDKIRGIRFDTVIFIEDINEEDYDIALFRSMVVR